ncbi:Coq4 family protein [Polyangium sp. 6x1]|uniref:Coq4 family protein n=1 Tax=Polyangium sp. 6x1 TaxID=3042689 RepID=UPI00248216C3|nr:Coq4 family protein [Polyangium sp. 6x1]MDI1447485.1 Coq4 family protein [Polyangium sp. 6x1]
MNDDTNPTLPANASAFTRIRLAIRALQILAKDPGNAYYGPLVNACMDSETYAKLAEVWRETPEGRRMLDERPSLQGHELDLDALARMPEGTLGHAFVGYFRDNGIEPFVSTFPVANDVDYLSKRYRETHDIFHLITGYGTDEPGEMELQAFVLGNLGVRQAILILAYSIPRQIQRDGVKGFGTYLGRLRTAYRRGRRSREMLSVSFEKLWDQPVSALSDLLCAPA